MIITNGPLNRDVLGSWLNDNGLISMGVEVGCAWGDLSKKVLSQWVGYKYYMVDSWRILPKEEYHENQSLFDYQSWKKQCEEIAEKDKRVVLVNMTSVEAVKLFTDNSLDFVYIDAAHDFHNVDRDIRQWWTKLKPGGLFGGHDFLTSPDPNAAINVDAAVERWAYENDLVLCVTPCTSWWVIKAG